jgi:hypothetical protein
VAGGRSQQGEGEGVRRLWHLAWPAAWACSMPVCVLVCVLVQVKCPG